MCFFFSDTATTDIYTLSLHDALPIEARPPLPRDRVVGAVRGGHPGAAAGDRAGRGAAAARAGEPASRTRRPADAGGDRKSTRLNSSHANTSYAVFCLKNKTF